MQDFNKQAKYKQATGTVTINNKEADNPIHQRDKE